MRLISNEEVRELVTTSDAITAMKAAFQSAGSGEQQTRIRTVAGGVMLSTMGAVLPGEGIAGAKVYTTIEGRFRFVILLFSTTDGRPLAAIEGDAMTGLRTAAATAVATDHLSRMDAQVLSIIGTGAQARAHVPALFQVRRFKEVIIAGIEGQQRFADEVARSTGVPVQVASIEDAARQADVLLTVTRSAIPLFDGDLLKADAFVAAVGASKASTRELDDRAIQRAATIVVEWKEQARQEAGDLVLSAPGTFDWENVRELAEFVDGRASIEDSRNGPVIYKAIGVGLEDVALAGLVYQRSIEGGLAAGSGG
jgi:ornithine cyclodeaminase/alanine dehydrogenase-like protein (mu-crystallin family)